MLENCACAAGLALGVALAAAPAATEAAPLAVTPTSVTLSAGRTTELVSLLDTGTDPARFEVKVFAWTEGPDGKTELTPTNDVAAFPPLMALGANQEKNIRLGLIQGAGPVEKSYRLVIQEIPDESGALPPGEIKVLTKISLPIFVAPPNARPQPKIEAAALKNGILDFALVNQGLAHFVARRIEAIGQGAASRSFDVGRAGWYVLAGGRRDFRLSLAGTDCRNTERIVIRAETDHQPVEAQLAVTAADCGTGTVTRFVEASEDNAPAAR